MENVEVIDGKWRKVGEGVELLVKGMVVGEGGVEMWIILVMVWCGREERCLKYVGYEVLMVV